MSLRKEQFYQTTKQYFLTPAENCQMPENLTHAPLAEKFYIKEEPFIDTAELEYA